jgi:hypothetical protein
MKKKISLCIAGGCPYAEIDNDNIKIFDDIGKLDIQYNENGYIVSIPKEWIKKISKELLK